MIDSQPALSPEADIAAAIEQLPMETPTDTTSENLSILRNIKIGTFNIGSAFADILGSGVWNRIMIADLGYAATPVSLLLGINYFLAPLVIFTGQQSDHTNIRGYRRLPWIWSGRLLMVLGFLLLPFMTVQLAENDNQIWWLGISFALMLTGIGGLISGSVYSALIYDRAPVHQRGRAIGLAWTMLLFGFAFSGVLFARLLPEYSSSGVITLFTTVAAIMAVLWFFSIWGEERTISTATPHEKRDSETRRRDFWSDWRTVWSNPATRLFFLYIGFSFTGAFAQDQILEPFGAEVFDLSTGETSRFAAFWGTTALLGSVAALYIQRRVSTMNYARINRWGIYTLILTFALLATTAFVEQESLIRPTLLIFGVGLGMWNIGAWGLMVSVSKDTHVGTYFGLWTMASFLFRGGGAVIGALIRDIVIFLSDNQSFAYGLVFVLEGLVLIIALVVINKIRFAEHIDTDTQEAVLIAVGTESN